MSLSPAEAGCVVPEGTRGFGCLLTQRLRAGLSFWRPLGSVCCPFKVLQQEDPLADPKTAAPEAKVHQLFARRDF
jgi:hypothetical protein